MRLIWLLWSRKKNLIAEAIEKGVSLRNLYEILRKNGFKGNSASFARMLEEMGIYNPNGVKYMEAGQEKEQEREMEQEEIDEGVMLIRSLYDRNEKTDKDILEHYKDEIAEALRHNVKLVKLYERLRRIGFKGSRLNFTKMLESFGLWHIQERRKRKGQASVASSESESALQIL